MPYINIHCHRPGTGSGVLEIVSLHHDFLRAHTLPYTSVGIHPWYITETGRELGLIRELASLPNVLAIGECGLGRLAKTPWSEQEHILKEQIAIARVVRKPMILHCVKAFQELIGIRKEQKADIPMIVHGYTNKPETARQLQQHGFLLSFGKALLRDDSNAAIVIRDWPADRLFLETDDSDVAISRIFEAAALLRCTDVEVLKRQVADNYNRIFTHG